jgi:hypothetical protein
MKKVTVLLSLIAISACSAALGKSPFDGTNADGKEPNRQVFEKQS